MNRTKLKKAFLTLSGHVVVLGGPFFIAETAYFTQQAYDEHWLSWASGLRIAAGFLAGGLIAGATVWFFITRPLVRRHME
jgi:hypothetical protein